MTLVYDLPLNSKVLVWRKSGNWNRPYRLLAVENKTYCVQLPSGPTSFRSTSVKPYFRPKDNYNIELDKLEVTIKPDKLGVPTKLDKLEAPLPTKEVPQKPNKPAKPTVKHGQGRPRKYPIAKSAVMEIYLTSAGIFVRQYPPADISVLVQETPFIDL